MEVHYPNNCLFIVERFQEHLTNNPSFFLAKIHRGMDYFYMNSAWLSQRRVNGLWVNGLFRGHLNIIYREYLINKNMGMNNFIPDGMDLW